MVQLLISVLAHDRSISQSLEVFQRTTLSCCHCQTTASVGILDYSTTQDQAGDSQMVLGLCKLSQ